MNYSFYTINTRLTDNTEKHTHWTTLSVRGLHDMPKSNEVRFLTDIMCSFAKITNKNLFICRPNFLELVCATQFSTKEHQPISVFGEILIDRNVSSIRILLEFLKFLTSQNLSRLQFLALLLFVLGVDRLWGRPTL